MAKQKNKLTTATEAKVDEVVEETTEETVEETPEVETNVSTGEAPKVTVTNVVISMPAEPDALPGPEVKMAAPVTIAEKALTIEEADTVEIVGIRGFEGIVGKVQEVRPDGYIVIKASNGTFAAPKANVVKA